MAAFLGARREWIWAPALYAGVVLALYGSIWIPVGQNWVFGWDALEAYWPDLAYLGDSFARGELPLWNPYDRGGYPFVADPQTGVFYPPNWICAAIAALLGETPLWLMQAKVLFHHALFGALMHAYLRSRGLPRAAAVFGGVASVVAAPIIIHKASALIWPLVWVPLVWIAIDRAIERERQPGWWRRAAALTAAIALPGSSLSPPGFFYLFLAALPYLALRVAVALVDAWRAGRIVSALGRVGRTLALAGGGAAAILAVIVVPAMELAARSPRKWRTLEYALDGNLAPIETLRGLVAPSAGVLNAYLGVAVLILAVGAAFGRPGRDRGVPALFFPVAVLFLLFSFGGETPLLPLFAEHVPGFMLFRICSRYTLVFAPLLVVCAAHGVAALLAGDRRTLIATLGGGAVALLFALILASKVEAPPYRGTDASYGLTIAAILATGALAFAATWLPPRVRHVAAAGLAALLFHDAFRFAEGRVTLGELAPDHRTDRAVVERLGTDVRASWRIYDEFVLEQRPGTRLGVRDFRGYPAGDPLEDVRYQDILATAAERPEILELYNVRWVLHGSHHRADKLTNWVWRRPDRMAPRHFRHVEGKGYEALHPAPMVAWYGGLRVVDGRRTSLRELLASEDEHGIRRSAVIEYADVPEALLPRIAPLSQAAEPPRRPFESVAGRVVSFAPGRVEATVYAPGDGVVVVNEAFYPGWRVTVDGAEEVPLRTNHLLRGVLVRGGEERTIVWTFRPRGWPWLPLAWGAGWLFVIAAAGSGPVWRAFVAARSRLRARRRPTDEA